MRGPEDAAGLVAAMLAGDLPAKVGELAARLNLPAAGLPGAPPVPDSLEAPRLVAAEERYNLTDDEWPAVLVNVLSIVRTEPVDTVAGPPTELGVVDADAGAQVWAVTYRVRVYVYARGEDYGDTDRRRKRLTLAARELLLTNRELDPQVAGAAVVAAWAGESYSSIEPRVGRSVAGAYVDVDVKLYEVARTAPAPQYQATTPLVVVDPPFPALEPLA